jgi:hypothetical protein
MLYLYTCSIGFPLFTLLLLVTINTGKKNKAQNSQVVFMVNHLSPNIKIFSRVPDILFDLFKTNIITESPFRVCIISGGAVVRNGQDTHTHTHRGKKKRVVM